jgi:hypothetical protein
MRGVSRILEGEPLMQRGAGRESIFSSLQSRTPGVEKLLEDGSCMNASRRMAEAAAMMMAATHAMRNARMGTSLG